jgi:hypothetical protein
MTYILKNFFSEDNLSEEKDLSLWESLYKLIEIFLEIKEECEKKNINLDFE